MRRHVCSVDREFKRHGDCVRIVTSNTLILPTKGTWNNGYQTLVTLPIKRWGGESRVEKEARYFSVVDFVSWKHEDWRIGTPLIMRIWVDLASGKSQAPYKTPLFHLFPSRLFLLCAGASFACPHHSVSTQQGRWLTEDQVKHRSNPVTSPQRRNGGYDQKTKER